MDELGWDAAGWGDIESMFELVRSPDDRKQKLALIAMARLVLASVPNPSPACQTALADADRFADSGGRTEFWYNARWLRENYEDPCPSAGRGFYTTVWALRGVDCFVAHRAGEVAKRASGEMRFAGTSLDAEREILARMRDIFGNPFRLVAFDPSCRTFTTVGLARTMCEARDFGAMPILADALEEAGCDSPDVLAHCRADTPHVRGCWAVDLVLGKS
jgi:hypothetical protein